VIVVAVADEVVIVAPAAVLVHIARALDREARLLPDGPNRAALCDTVCRIQQHSAALGRSRRAVAGALSDDGVMTHTAAANLLGVHRSTVARWADTGTLERVGRRIRTSSVEARL
jgi:excisionase family DNA binding protein